MELAILVLLTVAVLLVSYIGKLIYDRFVLLYYIHKVPGAPSDNLLFGNMGALMSSPEEIFRITRQWARKYYPIYKLWIGPMGAVNIVGPEDARLIMAESKHNKKSLIYNSLRRWLQNGLLVSDGAKWLHRRQILTPAFHFTILQDFQHVFNKRTASLIERLKKEVNKPVEINEIITNFTLRVIAETAMGRKLEFNSAKEKSYVAALHQLGNITVHRVFRGYLLYNWIFVFTKNFFKELQLVKTMHEFTAEIIADQETRSRVPNVKKKRMAMLDLLFACKSDGVIDDDGIREEVDTFMFEGHDTISMAICFGLMVLACHPEAQNQILQEMQEVFSGDTSPTYEDLQGLRYLERCIKEILRLYPSVPLISRMLGEDIVTSSGYQLKKNTIAQVYIYDIHHNPEIYPDPEKFDPDRFLPENCKDRHPYAFLPFSAGPRNCIGQKFAMMELKTVFCGILGNFVLEPVDTPDTIVFVKDFVLRTKDSIKVKFIPRTD